MTSQHLRQKRWLIAGLLLTCFCLYPAWADAQSAWLANHFMAKKIARLPDGTVAIREYPIICALSGSGPFVFDSCTQIITSRGPHKFRIQLVQDATNKLLQVSNYTVEAAYDGFIDARICHWKCNEKDSGWYRIEILSVNDYRSQENIGTFYFYVQREE